MSSPSSSDPSERSEIYWGSESASGSESPLPSEHPSPNLLPGSHNLPRPRLSSPRLFQGIFSSATSGAPNVRTNVRELPAPPHSNTHNIHEAFENVNRAILTAHQAFQNMPIVDLTTSSSPPPHRSRNSPARRGPLGSPSPLSVSSQRPHRTAGEASSQPCQRHDIFNPPNSNSASYSGPARKRRRVDVEHASADSSPPVPPLEVEAVDLTDVHDTATLDAALRKQRQNAIAAQMKASSGSDPPGRTPLTGYKCPICMDTPENATTTSCGHLFCHKCIIDTLRWSEEQQQEQFFHGKVKGMCPVCRKPLARNDKQGGGRTLIPLELKLSTKKRPDLTGKAVVRPRPPMAKRADALAKRDTDRENSEDMWHEYTVL